MENQGMNFLEKGSSDKLARMAQIFHLMGTDSKKNIDIILEQACYILDGACSLYSRMDDRQKSLKVWAGYNCPDDLGKEFGKEGHICWETTIKGGDKPVILPDLEATPFFTTDPYIRKYNLKSYLGFPVKLKNTVIGSLCILDAKTREFTKDEVNCIQTLAAALSLEEERLALEQEIIEEKKRYRILVENANDAIYIIQDGFIKFANPKTIELSGYKWKKLKKMYFLSLVHPDDQEKILQNHIKRLKGEKFGSTYSFRIINKKKVTNWVQLNAVRIIWEGKPAVLCCIRDITHVKNLEEKLQRAEKMELIGTMAGGVAHDLNNILSGLVSYPELLLMQIPPDSPLREPISFMHASGLKAADIVQDLLTLTRRGIAIETVISLNNVINEYFNCPAHKRLEENYPKVKFKTDSEADLLNICASPSHISKVIMNLVINAAEAIQTKGLVSVETFNKYIDSPLSGYDNILEGDYVVLRVTDDGEGIPQKDLNRIFEPFYTRKQMGRSGSGLGLSVVWNTVKDHKGYIEVRSKKNKGSVFELYFPATRKKTGKEPDDFLINDFKGNGATILVIDDVDQQRKIARDSLEMLGYKPFTVASGEKAILFLKIHTVDLVLLDMKMEPGIDGLETYKRILSINPGQKAIIASGFSENHRVKEALKLGAGQYIKKPYTIKKLAVALKKELTG
ncbi:MAG: PAS domain S-box protein [Deltaproteobacteria bacterium]|nr:PAS domain S-box protein [Deltaproteobacteria bacterium]